MQLLNQNHHGFSDIALKISHGNDSWLWEEGIKWGTFCCGKTITERYQMFVCEQRSFRADTQIIKPSGKKNKEPLC